MKTLHWRVSVCITSHIIVHKRMSANSTRLLLISHESCSMSHALAVMVQILNQIMNTIEYEYYWVCSMSRFSFKRILKHSDNVRQMIELLPRASWRSDLWSISLYGRTSGYNHCHSSGTVPQEFLIRVTRRLARSTKFGLLFSNNISCRENLLSHQNSDTKLAVDQMHSRY